MLKQLLTFLLMSCLVSAWTLPYTQPACLSDYSVNGFNFTAFDVDSIGLTCASNSFYYPLSTDRAVSTSSYYLYNQTHLQLNTSDARVHIPYDGANYTFKMNGTAGQCEISYDIARPAASTIGSTNVANCTMNYTGSQYNLTCINGGPSAGYQTNLTFNTSGAVYVYCDYGLSWPIFNDPSPKATINTTAWNASNYYNLQMYTSYCNLTHARTILYSDFAFSNATIANSNPICSNSSPYFRTLIVYGTTTILPKITFFPATGSYVSEAYPYYYDPTSALAFLRNNSVAYILDVNGIWYTVPAIEVVDTSVVYTVSAFLASTGISTAGTSIPVIPSYISCSETNHIYNISTNYSIAVIHLLSYRNATSINSSTALSSNFSYLINTSVYPIINYSVNGITLCRRTNSTSIFGIASFGTIDMGGASFIPTIIFVAVMAIGLFNPFAMVFAVIMNDLFHVITLTEMVIMLIIAVLSSIVMSAYDRSSIKAIVAYTMLGAAVVIQMFTSIGIDYSGLSQLTSGLSSFATCSSTTSAAACFDLLQFVQGTFGFMLALGVLLLTLPFVITGTLTNVVCAYAAPICIGGLFGSIMAAVGVLMYFTIGLIFYQIIRNSFISP